MENMNTHNANLDLSAIPPTEPESDIWESESELGLGVISKSYGAGGLGIGEPLSDGGVIIPVIIKSFTSKKI